MHYPSLTLSAMCCSMAVGESRVGVLELSELNSSRPEAAAATVVSPIVGGVPVRGFGTFSPQLRSDLERGDRGGEPGRNDI